MTSTDTITTARNGVRITQAVVTDRISATATVSAPKLSQKSVSARFWFRLTEFRPSYGYGRNQH